MAHRQGIVSTQGLIGGIARFSASGVLSAHSAMLHDEDCAPAVRVPHVPLFTRLRLLALPRPAAGAALPSHQYCAAAPAQSPGHARR